MMSRLRIQNFTIIGQGVPELRGGTNTHTDLRIYYIDDQIDLYKIENSKIAQFMCRDVKAIMSCMHDAGEKKTKVI